MSLYAILFAIVLILTVIFVLYIKIYDNIMYSDIMNLRMKQIVAVCCGVMFISGAIIYNEINSVKITNLDEQLTRCTEEYDKCKEYSRNCEPVQYGDYDDDYDKIDTNTYNKNTSLLSVKQQENLRKKQLLEYKSPQYDDTDDETSRLL